MSGQRELGTKRLLLRRWREADREPFAAMNADREVMAYLPARLDRAASDQLIARIETGFDQLGYGLWALELRAIGEFLGFTGLMQASVEAHFRRPSSWVGVSPGVPGGRVTRQRRRWRRSDSDLRTLGSARSCRLRAPPMCARAP